MDAKVLYWKLYPTQEQAFEAQRARPNDTMVTAMDKTMDGRKAYAVTSLASAYAQLMGKDIGRHQYELLMPLVTLRLYFDAEFSVLLNPSLDGQECCEALLYYIQCAYREIPNRPYEELPLDAVHIETSHRDGVKMSYHGKLDAKCGIVANMTAQRAFWARVRELIELGVAARDPRATMLQIVSKRKLPNGPEEAIEALFWDGNVYTKHRLMRFLGACKWPRAGAPPSYLVPEGQTRESITFEQWRSSLITVSFTDVPDNVVTLALPDEWFKLADLYWQTPVLTTTLTLAKQPHPPRTTGGMIQSYLAYSFPADAVATMLSMNGLVDLQYRHMSLSSLDGSYVHHFDHATRQELNRALHWRSASAIHVGEATTDDDPDSETGKRISHPIGRYTLRELCFDVDVTDYDKPFVEPDPLNPDALPEQGVRWCECKDQKKLCDDCWYMVEAAAAFIRDMLVRRMGIDERHILWVFSGSKGIHVWVNAAECLYLTHPERAANMARYIDIDLKRALTRDTRDPVIDALFGRLIYPHFYAHAIVKRQLLAPARANRILNQWADWIESFAPALASTWRSIRAASSEDAWSQVKAEHDAWMMTHVVRSSGNVPSPLAWVVAHYGWPRVDSNVTTERRHTLKAPFAVHATTRHVAIPIAFPGDGRKDGINEWMTVDENVAAHLGKSLAFQGAVKRLLEWCKWYNR